MEEKVKEYPYCPQCGGPTGASKLRYCIYCDTKFINILEEDDEQPQTETETVAEEARDFRTSSSLGSMNVDAMELEPAVIKLERIILFAAVIYFVWALFLFLTNDPGEIRILFYSTVLDLFQALP